MKPQLWVFWSLLTSSNGQVNLQKKKSGAGIFLKSIVLKSAYKFNTLANTVLNFELSNGSPSINKYQSCHLDGLAYP